MQLQPPLPLDIRLGNGGRQQQRLSLRQPRTSPKRRRTRPRLRRGQSARLRSQSTYVADLSWLGRISFASPIKSAAAINTAASARPNATIPQRLPVASYAAPAARALSSKNLIL